MKPLTDFKIFCNCCAKEIITNANLYGVYGRKFSCCSRKCYKETEHRYYASLCGEEYEPWTRKVKEEDKDE